MFEQETTQHIENYKKAIRDLLEFRFAIERKAQEKQGEVLMDDNSLSDLLDELQKFSGSSKVIKFQIDNEVIEQLMDRIVEEQMELERGLNREFDTIKHDSSLVGKFEMDYKEAMNAVYAFAALYIMMKMFYLDGGIAFD